MTIYQRYSDSQLSREDQTKTRVWKEMQIKTRERGVDL